MVEIQKVLGRSYRSWSARILCWTGLGQAPRGRRRLYVRKPASSHSPSSVFCSSKSVGMACAKNDFPFKKFEISFAT